MQFSSFDEMQKAVDVVGTSPHPANKIAATVFGTNGAGEPYSVSKTNFWPDVIAERIGTESRIGGSSGTLHAETACILAAPRTEGASLCVTDPFCPNCAKNMAEAGIRTVYIDHKGFDKDFAARRGGDFDSMSMRICERAGISVYEIRRKEGKLTPILEIPGSFKPPQENPLHAEEVFGEDFAALVKKTGTGKPSFAAALAKNEKGKVFFLAGGPHVSPGYESDAAKAKEEKYSFVVEPVNRLLMNAARRGLKLVDGMIYSAQAPTAREQVNLVGAGLTRFHIGDEGSARDEHALQALAMLRKAKILDVTKL